MRFFYDHCLLNRKRLGATILGAFVFFGLVGFAHSAGHHHPAPKAVSHATVRKPPASTTSTTTTVAATTTTSTTTLPPRQSLPAAASRAATTFVDTWADRNLPSAVWHRRIAALVTPAEQPGFAATDYPAAVPAGVRIVGTPIGSGDRGGAEVQVLTTKFPADLILAVVDGHWLVASFSE